MLLSTNLAIRKTIAQQMQTSAIQEYEQFLLLYEMNMEAGDIETANEFKKRAEKAQKCIQYLGNVVISDAN